MDQYKTHATDDEFGLGSRIGGYRIDAVIGNGGMGLVYDAYELANERRVALKVIAPRFASDPAFRALRASMWTR
jgi:serine/threonine-protein kinase